MEQMKRLYNKDISDQENVKVLNENGVNISLRTYKQYKKEMGLSKTYNKRPTSAQKQKDNEVITNEITSAERAQETPQKEVTIKAQETPNTYNNKYPHLVWINEMIHFENGMENANTIEELEQMKSDFEMKLKGFPQIPQTAEKVVNNSLKSTMVKYNKILESLINKA